MLTECMRAAGGEAQSEAAAGCGAQGGRTEAGASGVGGQAVRGTSKAPAARSHSQEAGRWAERGNLPQAACTSPRVRSNCRASNASGMCPYVLRFACIQLLLLRMLQCRPVRFQRQSQRRLQHPRFLARPPSSAPSGCAGCHQTLARVCSHQELFLQPCRMPPKHVPTCAHALA